MSSWGHRRAPGVREMWSKNSTSFHSKIYLLHHPCSRWVPTLCWAPEAGFASDSGWGAEFSQFPRTVGPGTQKMPIPGHPAQPSGSTSRSHPSQSKLSGLPRAMGTQMSSDCHWPPWAQSITRTTEGEREGPGESWSWTHLSSAWAASTSQESKPKKKKKTTLASKAKQNQNKPP